MKPYANLSGNSGVVAYDIRPGAILVRFRDGDLYEYNDGKAGAAVVMTMQQLARAGIGLSTFITQRKPGFVRR
jgi:hypothetical protein